MKIRLLVAALSLAMPVAALAQTSTTMGSGSTMGSGTMGSSATMAPGTGMSGKLSMQDTHFIKMAAISGMSEVNDGKLAATMGGTDAVKTIGNTMVADHTKANNQLMALAQQKGAMVPADVDAKHAAMHAGLEKLSGSAFDKAYLKEQVMGHEMTIALFKTEASAGSDPDLKNFATTTLPTLEQHLAMIKAAM